MINSISRRLVEYGPAIVAAYSIWETSELLISKQRIELTPFKLGIILTAT